MDRAARAIGLRAVSRRALRITGDVIGAIVPRAADVSAVTVGFVLRDHLSHLGAQPVTTPSSPSQPSTVPRVAVDGYSARGVFDGAEADLGFGMSTPKSLRQSLRRS